MFPEIDKTGSYKHEAEYKYTISMSNGSSAELTVVYAYTIDVDMDYGSDIDGKRGVKAVTMFLDDVLSIHLLNGLETIVPTLVLTDIESQISSHLNASTHLI